MPTLLTTLPKKENLRYKRAAWRIYSAGCGRPGGILAGRGLRKHETRPALFQLWRRSGSAFFGGREMKEGGSATLDSVHRNARITREGRRCNRPPRGFQDRSSLQRSLASSCSRRSSCVHPIERLQLRFGVVGVLSRETRVCAGRPAPVAPWHAAHAGTPLVMSPPPPDVFDRARVHPGFSPRPACPLRRRNTPATSRMSALERPAAMPPMIGFSRSALFPGAGLKLPSCFCRYSGTWLASFGLAEVGLLPSAPWQAAQTPAGDALPLRGVSFRHGFRSGERTGRKLRSSRAPRLVSCRFPPRKPSLKRLIF